jgi:uncharacterized membrane protein YtjA (UPF0391 family)
MLNAAIVFFVMGLLSILLGANGMLGSGCTSSVEIGKTLLFTFIILALISFVVALATKHNRRDE